MTQNQTTGWDKRADMLVHETDPYNAEPPPDALLAAVTPYDAFYSRNHGPIPRVEAAQWRLRVEGRVDREVTLDLVDLRALPRHEVVATMQCAGNRRSGLIDVREVPGEDPWRGGAIGTARWAGARLADVLDLAGPGGTATDVAFAAPDVSQIADPPQAYGSSIPLDKARSPEVLLAYEMDGDPLPRLHGGPVRVVVPGWIGARSVKWVQEIIVGDRPSDTYFQATAYRVLPPEADPAQARPGDGISLGPWALNSEILQPASGASVTAGSHRVAGYAVAAERRRVARVEVSVDDGRSWADAELDGSHRPWTWRHWHLDVELAPGPRILLARAWDDTAAQQPSDPAALWNPKGYANTSWARAELHLT